MSTNLKKRAIVRFHALLSVSGMRNQKEAILAGYGVESTKDLTLEQLEQANAELQKLAQQRDKDDKKLRKWRSNVIATLEEMGIYRGKSSWPKVNEFLKQPRVAGKLLYECSIEELQALNRKLFAMKAKFDQDVEKDNFWASNN